MNSPSCPLHQGSQCCCRREFLQVLSTTAAGLALTPHYISAAEPEPVPPRNKLTSRMWGAFLYPPSESLRKEGYWSWPGSGFDAEGREQKYTARLRELAAGLEMDLTLEGKPLDDAASVSRFIEQVKTSKPDGLLLIPFKKSHWTHVVQIVEQTQVPAVVLATLGVLLVEHINQLHRRPGVYLISSLDDLDAVAWGMKMIKAARWMKDARLLNILGQANATKTVPNLGTEVRTIPHARFVEEFQRLAADEAVKPLARSYRQRAKKIVEPNAEDIHEAARTYFAFKRLLAAEHADAVMMECLTGLRLPHQHVPPCMGFMSLRDEGIAAGCQADLNPTLTMMMVQQLLDLPGFQQNAAMNTERNLYFGSHCTCPSRMRGRAAPPEPFILRNHAEAGWGCVPQVLFTKGQEVTMALYLSGQKPQMLLYTGKVVDCPPSPPVGGCRTNIEMTINEVRDVCDVKGMHQIIFYGNHAQRLRAFCQLHGIEVVS